MIRKVFTILSFLLIVFTIKNVEAVSTKEQIDEYSGIIKYWEISSFAIDDLDENYKSKTYQIYNENLEITKYEVTNLEGFPEGSYIANADNGSRQNEFTSKETKFKVMVPKDLGEEDFFGTMKVHADFKAIKTYLNGEGQLVSEYVTDSNEQQLKLDSRHSVMTIKIIDSETGNFVENVKLRVKVIDGINDETKEIISGYEGVAVVGQMGEGNVVAKVISVPEGYSIPKGEYTYSIGKKDVNCNYNLEIRKEIGKIHIKNNTKYSKYEIYNSMGNKIITCETNENGEITLENLYAGTYMIIQREVEDGYIIAENFIVQVIDDKTSEVVIENQLKDEESNEKDDKEDIQNTENQKDEEGSKKQEQNVEESDSKEDTNGEKTEDVNIVENNKEEVNKEEENSENEENHNKTDLEDNQEKELVENKENMEETNLEPELEDTKEESKEQEELKEVNGIENNITEYEPEIQNYESQNQETLPRTGDDYFLIKLLVIEMSIFFTFCKIKLKKQTKK